MMKNENDIYPKSVENVVALVKFYFEQYDLTTSGVVEEIMSFTSISLAEVKLILKALSEAYTTIFEPQNIKDLKIMFSLYGVNAYKRNIPKVSKSGLTIFNEFFYFISRTDLTSTSNDK